MHYEYIRSTLITNQLPVENWHEMIGDGTLADAILDRLVHNAHKIKMRESPCENDGRPPKVH